MTEQTPPDPSRPPHPVPPTEPVYGDTPQDSSVAHPPGSSDPTTVVPPSNQPPVQPPPGAAPAGQPDESSGPNLLVIGAIALVAALGIGFALLAFAGGSDDDAAITSEPVVSDPISSDVEPTNVPATTTTLPSATATELARSVVQIIATFPGGQCTGSGTIIDERGVILTNSHVITRSQVCPWEELQIATVDTPDLPPRALFTGAVVADDPALDLAVVRIAGRLDGGDVVENFPAVEIGESAGLELGAQLRILGFPGIGGETITFTEGTISGFIEQPGLGTRSWVKTDASIAGGNSGGLAADSDGRIVGVPSRAGTGDVDDITDCRLVADTNNDGSIDEGDSCIPIGGFINGIRPIDAAGPIIAEGLAAGDVPSSTLPPTTLPATTVPPTTAPPTTAPPTTTPPAPAPPEIRAFNPRFSVQNTNGFPDPQVFVVPEGAPQLCLTWQYSGLNPGTPFEVTWNVDGNLIEEASFSGTSQGGVDGDFFGCVSNSETGLPSGSYQMTWNAAGEQVFTHSIYVGGGRPALTIGLQNNTDSRICVVAWTPIGQGFNLSLNTSPVEPGTRFETVLPAGRYRTLVGDCAGNVVFQDPDTDFATELTLTLPI